MEKKKNDDNGLNDYMKYRMGTGQGGSCVLLLCFVFIIMMFLGYSLKNRS